MGMLGITNRSENWKTAETFAPFFKDGGARTRLVSHLLQPFGEANQARGSAIKIELFWYGMRDYIHQTAKDHRIDAEAIAASYEKPDLFQGLRESIQSFRAEAFPYKFWPLQPGNYNVSKENWQELYSNTQAEIDIVLETPNHLFIGEAKHEEDGFETYGSAVLVHQLVREYVIAKVLVDLLPGNRQVVPFVVGDSDKLASLQNTVQVKFMMRQGWLRKENVLSWDCIEKLAASTPGNG